MPFKKKTAVVKSTGKSQSESSVSRDGGARRRPTAVVQEAAGGSAGSDARMAAQTQVKSFEHAVRLFHSRKFAEARDLFSAATVGPNREMAHNAALHVRMCESRLSKPVVDVHTAEEHYNYGVAMINVRNLTEAQQHLEAALKLEPQKDYIYYALALAKGLAGDIEGAHENLKRAIELDPRNRIAARQDADFAGITNQPQIHDLLYPDKSGAA